MKTYTGDLYSTQISSIIDDCIHHAKSSPFALHYLIVDDQKYFEEILLKRTDTLFNIEIINSQDFLRKLLHQGGYIDYQMSSQVENIMTIVRILKKKPDSLFTKNENAYQTAKILLDIFQEIYLNNITNCYDGESSLSRRKCKELFEIYDEFINSLTKPFHYFDDAINVIDHTFNDYYYCLSSRFSHQKGLELLNKLDQFGDVVYYDQYTKNHIEDRDYASHTCRYLFESETLKSQESHPYELLAGNTMIDEINQVVYDLFLKLKNHQCQDFAIYYPNQQYYDVISSRLSKLNIQYNEHTTSKNAYIQTLMILCDYLKSPSDETLLSALSYQCFYAFEDIKTFSYLQNQYRSFHSIQNENYQIIKNHLSSFHATSIVEISTFFIDFIQNHMSKNEETFSLIHQLSLLNDHDECSLNDYQELLMLSIDQHHSIKEKKDSVYLFKYSQPYSELLNIKEIYCLGFNETMIPKEFNNTGILLNDERSSLKMETTVDALYKHQKEILHVFSSHHQRIVLSYALSDLQDSQLLPSSVIKKMRSLFNLTPFALKDLLHPVFMPYLYLDHQKDEGNTQLNKMIDDYVSSKNQVPPLSVDIAKKRTSVSRIEKYNLCPYSYFQNYVLNVRKGNDYHFQAVDIGNIVHDCIEKNNHYFYDFHSVSFDSLQDDIDETVDDYVKKNLSDRSVSPVNQFIIRLIKDHLYNVIVVLSKQMQAGQFTNTDNELQIKGSFSDFDFLGKIDRVDRCNQLVKIVDYKSSDKALKFDLAKVGINIQMIIYLELLVSQMNYAPGALFYINTTRKHLDLKGISSSLNYKGQEEDYTSLYRPTGMMFDESYDLIDTDFETKSLYCPITKNKDGAPIANRSSVMDRNDFIENVNEIKKHIHKLYTNMQEGCIDIRPAKYDSNPKVDACKYCDYKSICHFDIFYNEERDLKEEI